MRVEGEHHAAEVVIWQVLDARMLEKVCFVPDRQNREIGCVAMDARDLEAARRDGVQRSASSAIVEATQREAVARIQLRKDGRH